MPEENENPIEKALRSYKKERTKNAPLPLHPATRKMLQSEVARAYPPPGGNPRKSFRAFWPQIAFGSGLCAILIIAVLSLRERHPNHESKQHSIASAESLPQLTAPTGNERLERPRELETLSPAKEKKTDARAKSTAPSIAPSDAPVPAERRARAFNKDLAASGENPATLQIEAVQREATVKTQAENKSEASEKIVEVNRAPVSSNLDATIRLRFAEVADATKQGGKNPILTSFQVEKNGTNLRFLDSDGSVYSGQLSGQQVPQSVANSIASGRAVSPSRSAPVAASSEETTTYSFIAQGTNRTLQKPVVLQGSYIERTNRSRHAITGTATVGQTNKIPINAISSDQ